MSAPDPSLLLSSRLAALHETGLLDSPVEQSLDRYVRIASLALGTPVNLVSLVDHDRQFFAAAKGLPNPWDEARQTPLSHSFCQHVVAGAKPFLVSDARQDPRVQGNLAITEMSVTAYAGMPITAGSEQVVGSFCAIDSEPRQWSARDLEILTELSELVSHELELRRKAQRVGRVENQIATMQAKLAPINTDLADRVEMIAHDLRTPFQTMSIVAGLLRTHPAMAASEALTGLLDRLDRNLIQASAMVASLGSAEVLEQSGHKKPIEVARLIHGVCEDLRPLNNCISIQVHGNCDLKISGNEVGLRRCLFNLVSNAMRFAESTVQVTSLAGTDTVSVIVEDDGPGLPEATDWNNVWEPGVTFHRDDGRSNSGLGLTITKDLATRDGARVNVSRSPLGGAQFELHFPACV